MDATLGARRSSSVAPWVVAIAAGAAWGSLACAGRPDAARADSAAAGGAPAAGTAAVAPADSVLGCYTVRFANWHNVRDSMQRAAELRHPREMMVRLDAAPSADAPGRFRAQVLALRSDSGSLPTSESVAWRPLGADSIELATGSALGGALMTLRAIGDSLRGAAWEKSDVVDSAGDSVGVSVVGTRTNCPGRS